MPMTFIYPNLIGQLMKLSEIIIAMILERNSKNSIEFFYFKHAYFAYLQLSSIMLQTSNNLISYLRGSNLLSVSCGSNLRQLSLTVEKQSVMNCKLCNIVLMHGSFRSLEM